MLKELPVVKAETPDYGIYFRTAAEKFQIIDSSRQRAVLVRYGRATSYRTIEV